MNTITSLTSQQLRQAASIKEQIAALEKQLTGIVGTDTQPKSGRKTMSAAARAKIAAGQKARWAKAEGKSAPSPVKQGKGKMSAAAKARLSKLAKARWAKVRAAGKKKL
jgi:hypothetical protein